MFRSSKISLPSNPLVPAVTKLLQNPEEYFGDLEFKCVNTEEEMSETILCHRAIILSRTTPEFRSSYFLNLEELTTPSNTNQTIQLSIPSQTCKSIIHYIYTDSSTMPDVTQQLSDNPPPSITGFDVTDFTNNKHKMKFKLDLLRMWRDSICTDITLALGTSLRFPVHRCILSVHSPYFQAMLLSPFQESHLEILQLNDEVVTPNALILVLGFMYTGDLLFSLLPTKSATPSTPSTSLSSTSSHPTPDTESSSPLKASLSSSKTLSSSSKNSLSSSKDTPSSSKNAPTSSKATVTPSLSKPSPAKTSISSSKSRVLGQSSASPTKHLLTPLKSNLTLPVKRQRFQILQNLHRSADYFSMESLITLTQYHISALVHHFSDSCVDCCALIPQVLSFSSENGLDILKESALENLSNPLKISSWSHRAFTDLSASLHEEILSSTLTRVTVPNTIQVLTQLHTLQNSQSITSITKPLLIHTSHLLADHIRRQTRPALDIDGHELSTPLLDLLVGIGFATDSLEFILNSLVDNLTDNTAVSVYQAFVVDLLSKQLVKDNTQVREVIEQAKTGVVAYLRRRWVGIKAIGWFKNLEGIIEKIAKDIGVDVEELKLSDAGTAELGGFSLGDTEFVRRPLRSSPLNKIVTSKTRPTTTTSSPSPSSKSRPGTTSSSLTVTRGRVGTSVTASRRGTSSAAPTVVSPALTRASRATTTARGSTLSQTSSRGNASGTAVRGRGITTKLTSSRTNTGSRPTSSSSPATSSSKPRSTSTTTNIPPRNKDTENASPSV